MPGPFRLCLIGAALIHLALPALGDEALGGFDVVSLRDSGRPIRGDASISTHWKGRSWVFANEANRAAFESNPRAYAPAFGGNCPVALADGRVQKGNPAFAVVVQKTLYLTHDAAAKRTLESGPGPILDRAAKAWAKLR